MSQAKVDRYKEEKANRQKIMQKEKREKLLWKLGCYAVLLALVIWIGYSAFDRLYEPPIRYYDADVTALSDYMNGLSAQEEETDAAEDTTEAQDAAEETTEAQGAAEDTTEAQDTTEAATETSEGTTEAQESAAEE